MKLLILVLMMASQPAWSASLESLYAAQEKITVEPVELDGRRMMLSVTKNTYVPNRENPMTGFICRSLGFHRVDSYQVEMLPKSTEHYEFNPILPVTRLHKSKCYLPECMYIKSLTCAK